MKNRTIGIFVRLLLILTTTACQKDEEETIPEPVLPRNSATVTMNGKPWNATLSNGTTTYTMTSCFSCWAERLDESYKNYFGISLNRYFNFDKTNRYYFEGLSFNAIPLKVGTYELKGRIVNSCRPDTIPASAFSTSEHDVGKDRYYVLQTEKNYLKVANINKETGLIEGEFMATYIRVSKAYDSTYPDTVRFQPSKFSAFIGVRE